MKNIGSNTIPLWLNDNPHILSWHRPIHNETLNIWSHLGGSIIMLYLWIFYVFNHSTKDTMDVPIHVFFFFSIICLLSSASFHLLMCHSEKIKTILNKLDYLGIIMMVFGSSFPMIYFIFYCNPMIRNFYIALNCIFCMIIARIATEESFQQPEKLCIRGTLFVIFGSFGIIPFFHTVLGNNHAHLGGLHKFERILIMGLVYTLGAILYAIRFPERLKPGAFDLLLNSHQLLHICVLIGALIHYATIKYYVLTFKEISCHK